MSNTFKALVKIKSGLNDLLGNLVRVYYMFEHLEDSVISLYSPQYSSNNLSKYINFNNKIKLIQNKQDANNIQYDYRSGNASGYDTSKYTTAQINKVFSIKPEFVNLFKEYNDHICIHFRHMRAENSIRLAKDKGIEDSTKITEDEFKDYKERFIKKYDPNKKYLIISDSSRWSSEFQDKDNIERLIPTTDINPCRNDSSRQRNKQLELSIHQICAAAHCKKIYKTTGHFLGLTRCINDKVIFLKL